MIGLLPFSFVLEALAIGYLLGSIPFGLIFAFAWGVGDVRKIGSGNIGATNVLRTGKKWAAAATLLGDGLKAVVAVLLVRSHLPAGCENFAALAAVLGHIYPFWLKFKGGKGVATFIGATWALYWPVGLLVGASWLLATFIWRTSSLSALIAVALSPVYFFVLGRHGYASLAALLAVLIFFTHRENIRRLLQSAEPHIGGTK